MLESLTPGLITVEVNVSEPEHHRRGRTRKEEVKLILEHSTEQMMGLYKRCKFCLLCFPSYDVLGAMSSYFPLHATVTCSRSLSLFRVPEQAKF